MNAEAIARLLQLLLASRANENDILAKLQGLMGQTANPDEPDPTDEDWANLESRAKSLHDRIQAA
ncbi:MAG: hypothetical protein IIA00_07190 [Proteobacteria bacterium]|nr:hypothetical protein [Pseudomonadota bacterium]